MKKQLMTRSSLLNGHVAAPAQKTTACAGHGHPAYPFRLFFRTAILLFFLFPFHTFSQCSVTGPDEVCAGDISVYVTAYSGASYDWTVNGGNIVNSQNGSVTIAWITAGAGNVTVQVKDVSQNVLATCSLTVQVNSVPMPVITSGFVTECVEFIIDDNGNIIPRIDPSECWKVCDSSTVHYSVPYNSNSTYTWEVFGNISAAVSPNGNEITVEWGMAGSGLIRVTETGSSGCTHTAEKCIAIMKRPTTEVKTLPALEILPNGEKELTVCLYENVHFKGYFYPGISNSPVMHWHWDFGDGQVSIEQNPEHMYTVPGTYRAKLIVTNQCGCQASDELIVHVSPDIPATIECASPVCANDTATYFTYAFCSNYQWSVTNGVIISPIPYGSSVTVVWNAGQNGPGVVTLETPGCDGYCNEPTSIEIPILFAGFEIIGPDKVCVDEQVKYSVPLIPGTEYIWYVPGGSNLIGQGTHEILVNWTTIGPDTIRVEYTNEFLGCGGSRTMGITVKNDFELSLSSDKICDLGSVTFSTTPSGIFKWYISDAASYTTLQTFTGINGDLTIANWPHGPGTFKVSASSSAFCASRSVLVKVEPAPPAPGGITGDDYVCPDKSYSYFASPSSPDYFIKWYVSNGSPATMEGNEITVTWNSTGPYSLYVTQVDMLSGCESPPSQVFNVNKIIPVAPVLTVADPQCINSIVTYSISNSSAIYADEIQWEVFPATAGSVIQTANGGMQATIQWNATPTVNVEIRLKAKTCGVVDPLSPYIFGLDLVGIFEVEIATDINPVCDASPCTLSVPNLPPGVYTYSWNFEDGGTSVLSSPIHTFHSSNGITQTVSVTVTDANQCSAAANKILGIRPGPGANILKSGTDCPDFNYTVLQSGPNFTYLWSTSETTHAISVHAEGQYWVEVTDITTLCKSKKLFSVNCYSQPGNCIQDLDLTFGYLVLSPECGFVDLYPPSSLPPQYTSFLWRFGDGTVSTDPNEDYIQYHSAGTYHVCLFGYTATGDCGVYCTQITIPVFADFDVGFRCNTNPNCTNCYDIVLHDKSSHDPNVPGSPTWTWEEGSTLLATGQNPPIISLTPGLHTITLTVEKDGYFCQKEMQVNVPEPPVPAFSVSSGPVCAGFTPVQFTYTGTGIANIASATWDFGGNAYSNLFPLTGPQTERVYDNVSTYLPTLTVKDLYGCSYTAAQITPIDVQGNDLAATYNPQGIISFCPGGSQLLQLTQTGTSSPDGYLWSTGATTAQIWVNQTGAYSVTMTNSLTGCELKLLPAAQVALHNIPVPVISGDLTYCAGEDVRLISFLGNGYTYNWTATKNGSPFTNFNTPSDGVFEIQLADAGNYVVTVSLTSSANTCTTTTSVPLYVLPNPAVPDITASSSPACEGSLLQLSVTNAGTHHVNWSNGAVGPDIQVYHAGIYQATFTNEKGCTSSAHHLVHPLPDFSFILSGCFEFCDSEDIEIPGDRHHSYPHWEWQVSRGGNLEHQFSGQGAVDPLRLSGMDYGYYTVQLYAITAEGCESWSEPIYLSVKSCACEYFGNPAEIKPYCLFKDATGITHYLVLINLPAALTSHCLSDSTTLIVTSPDGAFTPTVPFPNNPMYGLFVPFSPGIESACFDFDLSNPELDYKNCNCLYSQCEALPKDEDCTWPDDCEMEIAFESVSCTNGGPPIVFNLNIYSINDLTVWFSVPYGTLTGMPQTLVAGSNPIEGRLIAYPIPAELCITVNGYDSLNRMYCRFEFCYEDRLPDCSRPYRLADRNSRDEQAAQTGRETRFVMAPNPAGTLVRVGYSLSSSSGRLSVTDVRGKAMMTVALYGEQGEINLNTSNLNPGIYWVRVQSTSGESAGSRLVILD